MAGPWEKYQAKPSGGSSKPWEKYQGGGAPIDYEAEATLAAEKKYEENKPRKLESGLLGAYQGITRDWGDELAAGVASTFKKDLPYEDAKRQIQDRFQTAERENPKSYGTGEFAGAAAATPLAATPVGMAALGASDAAARSLGKSKDLSADSAVDALEEGATGAVMGGTIGTLAPYLSQGVSKVAGPAKDKLANYFKNKAAERAVQALRPTQGQMRKLQESGKLTDVGTMMLDEGVVTPFATNKTMSQRAQDLPGKFGEQMRPIYEQSKNSRMSPDELTGVIGSRMGELSSDFANKPIVGKLGQYQTDIAESGAQSFNPSDLGRNRRKLSDMVNYNSDAVSQEGTKEMARILREQEMGLIEKIEPELRAQNEKLFRQKHLAHLAEDIAPRAEARNSVNNILGLNTYATGGIVGPAMAAAGASGGMIAGATGAAMAAREIARRYGPQMSAVAAKKLENVIQSPKYAQMFEKAMQKGPKDVLILHNMLQKNDPEYNSQINSDEPEGAQ